MNASIQLLKSDRFYSFFSSGLLADFTLTDSRNKVHSLHKVVSVAPCEFTRWILGSQSDFFKTNFLGGFLKDKDAFKWNFEDEDNVLPIVCNNRCNESYSLDFGIFLQWKASCCR